ncbi:phosphatase PAP2 family protein [Hymenobacter latericus]|uniref:phosphatase PAP2 family protein n=1 Tax=Hymenobacter sp. YIM 151858-1 TaxID=2987688 RepID=UPI0022269522|nr:phosphatase PAP2 family protein [Hymenobacter sp. YIM 151858-1]UYZ59756.1 phosphatase PAP2 family protein [Hymenobacter sp. YIM 151858-1]
MPPDSSARPLKTCVDSLLRHGRTVYYTVRGHAAWVRQRPVVQKFGVPVLLIGTGAIIRNEVELFELEMEIDESVRDGAQRHLYGVRTNIDDYLRHVPAYATLGLSVAGVKGSNKILDQALLLGLIYQVNSGITSHLKRWTQVERPNGQNQRSFPSSHTSTAFATAHFMHKEYGHRSAWYSVGAYAMATSTAALRVAKDNHWTSDVVAGAGVGILSTELAYWAYPALKRTAQRLGQHLGRKPKQQASGGTQVLVSPYYAQGAVGACLMVGLR